MWHFSQAHTDQRWKINSKDVDGSPHACEGLQFSKHRRSISSVHGRSEGDPVLRGADVPQSIRLPGGRGRPLTHARPACPAFRQAASPVFNRVLFSTSLTLIFFYT